jgi:septin family protein
MKIDEQNTNTPNSRRNILLVGKTGDGKSALANVLVDSEQTKTFKESDSSSSETKQAKSETFEVTHVGEKIIYQIIDTVGLCDTDMDEKDIFLKLSEAIELLNGEINQILFVVGGRFSKEEEEVYNLFKNTLFFDRDCDISKYTTIVRTKFNDFEDRDECEMDRKILEEKIPDDIHIIYVDNPSLKGSDKKIDVNKESRKASQEILMRYLLDYCRKNYRPSSLKLINDRINEHVKKGKEFENEEKSLQEQLRRAKEQGDSEHEKILQKKIDHIKKSIENENKEKSEKMKRGLIDVINQAGENWKQAAVTGVEQGNKVLPLVGGAVGGSIGVSVGAVGTAFSALGYMFTKIVGGEI